MSNYIKTISDSDYLKIDTLQMIEVDRLMMEDYHIDLIQMMENAGRCLAIVAREVFFYQMIHKVRKLPFLPALVVTAVEHWFVPEDYMVGVQKWKSLLQTPWKK